MKRAWQRRSGTALVVAIALVALTGCSGRSAEAARFCKDLDAVEVSLDALSAAPRAADRVHAAALFEDTALTFDATEPPTELRNAWATAATALHAYATDLRSPSGGRSTAEDAAARTSAFDAIATYAEVHCGARRRPLFPST